MRLASTRSVPDWTAAQQLTPGLVFAALIGYAALRARLMSFTCDEAVTYMLYVRNSFHTIFHYVTPGLPDNNHLLLSLFSRAITLVLGVNEFALRLPVLIGFALFLVALYSLLRLFITGLAMWLAFFFVALNPYIIDLMTVARGYGLAIALSMSGAWLVLRGAREDKRRRRFQSLGALFFGLAVLAHFSFLLLYASYLAMRFGYVIVATATGRIDYKRALVEIAFPSAMTAALIAVIKHPLQLIMEAGLLQPIDGQTSFLTDTVFSLSSGSLYHVYVRTVASDALGLACLFVVALATGLVIINLLQKDLGRKSLSLAAVLLFLYSTAIGSVLQHHLFGVSYLAGRHALFFIPIFGILCALTVANLEGARSAGRRIAYAATIGLMLAPLPVFVAKANLSTTQDWAYDASTKMMMRDVASTHARDGMPVTIGAHWKFEWSINYYRETLNLSGIAPAHRGFEGNFDYYYVDASDQAALEESVGPVRVVKYYPASDTILAVRREGA